MFTADNPIGAGRGDLVRVDSQTGPVLKAAFVLYVLPLVLFFLGYYLGTLAGNWGAVAGCLGFVLGVAMVVLYDRTVVKKQNLGYTITALVEAFQPRARIREEENHG